MIRLMVSNKHNNKSVLYAVDLKFTLQNKILRTFVLTIYRMAKMEMKGQLQLLTE